ncbi:PAS domain S-box protein [Geobacter sp. DSM 9736]|uniref:PAS domain-containing hybrid sensor histidine kinase/response regulator n=1 Tax=Geobacter sp. DSM 9736 TaxID=1277350 RepID=UPI000B50A5FF|nr:PAS domain S-box protein [Geobacter sp. DSM 9736]
MLLEAHAERDYYRHVAERLGQKSLSDTQDFTRLIHNLRQTEEKLRLIQEELEKTIAERTAELLRSNEDLRESTSRYDELVRRIPNGVYTLRFSRDGSMQFDYLSPQICEILALDCEELMRDAGLAFAIAHPEDRDNLEKASLEATRTRTPFRWEGRFIIRNEIRWVRLEADPTTNPQDDVIWNGVLSDVTHRKLTEEKLRESEELYRLLTEVAPNAITVADPTGEILMANRKALELFGHADESEAVGKPIFQWIPAHSVDTACAALDELFRKGTLSDLELKFVRRDGTEFTGEANASLLRDSHGEPKLIVIVTSDTTQKKQAEAERLKLQKLEAIGTLAGGIAHDFNNLLQGVFGYITMARMEIDHREGALALLDQAEQAMSQAVNLTSQLLTFAKGGTPVKKKVSLRQAIENATRFALSGSSSTCTITIADDLWAADADEGQIGQVIQNIVLNASQAMGQSGTVEISADNVDLKAGSNQALPEGGRFIRIQIRDTGIGMPPHYLSKIFDPYFTTKQKGSGLGLATSHSIVKRHGGAISVLSEPDKGTIFSVHLPATALESSDIEEAAPAPQAISARKGRILVMDDEEMVRDVSREMIEMSGYEVECAAEGEEAIEKIGLACSSGTPFDVVILDLTVKGGMGGEEAIGRIREIAPGIRAIVSSGYADNAIVADYRGYGFDAYLNKPYTLSALREMLSTLLPCQ